jgi:hypothetical protein
MVTGIGRKTTDEELIDYLSKDDGGAPIDIEVAFSKYSSGKKIDHKMVGKNEIVVHEIIHGSLLF